MVGADIAGAVGAAPGVGFASVVAAADIFVPMDVTEELRLLRQRPVNLEQQMPLIGNVAGNTVTQAQAAFQSHRIERIRLSEVATAKFNQHETAIRDIATAADKAFHKRRHRRSRLLVILPKTF